MGLWCRGIGRRRTQAPDFSLAGVGGLHLSRELLQISDIMKRIIGQILTWMGVLAVFGLSVIRTSLDIVGYSTAQSDASGLPLAAQAALTWLLSLPWWIPWGTFLLAFMWLAWWSWTPDHIATSNAAELLKERRLMKKEERALAVAVEPAKPLTAHAVERKLKVIDQALDLLKGTQPLLDRGPALLRDDWHTTGVSGVIPYSVAVRSLIADVRAFSRAVDDLRNSNQEYQDIVRALQQTYFNDTISDLSAFANGCEHAAKALSEGATITTVYHPLVGNYVGTFEQGLRRLGDWRNSARGKLMDIRHMISTH